MKLFNMTKMAQNTNGKRTVATVANTANKTYATYI